MSAGTIEQLANWTYLAPLEQAIKGSESTSLLARWRFGCYLRDEVPKQKGGRGKVGPLAAIAAELDVSERELHYRRQFATLQYIAEFLLCAELFESWYAVITQALSSTAHLSSAKDEWATPQGLFDALDAEFGFTLDVCAQAENAKCATYYSENSLDRKWQGVCWMNPPYSEIDLWMAKALRESQEGATVVCLVPSRTDVGWFWEYARHGEIRFLCGRLHFVDDQGNTGPAPFPSCLVVFGREPTLKLWEW